MDRHLFDQPLPVRLPGLHGGAGERIDVFEIRVICDRFIVQMRSGQGYYYLARPYGRDPDGVLVAAWVDDPRAYHEWGVGRTARPCPSREFDPAVRG